MLLEEHMHLHSKDNAVQKHQHHHQQKLIIYFLLEVISLISISLQWTYLLMTHIICSSETLNLPQLHLSRSTTGDFINAAQQWQGYSLTAACLYI